MSELLTAQDLLAIIDDLRRQLAQAKSELRTVRHAADVDACKGQEQYDALQAEKDAIQTRLEDKQKAIEILDERQRMEWSRAEQAECRCIDLQTRLTTAEMDTLKKVWRACADYQTLTGKQFKQVYQANTFMQWLEQHAQDALEGGK